ncbi:hypothetical protein ACFRAQ_20840 [Nocardia sp. NPDC056611]|uniref:hypothetical protein n=1 Tax=Nocardia sp. NPDC056611 TaxID=3345877 RepID=UPI003671C166
MNIKNPTIRIGLAGLTLAAALTVAAGPAAAETPVPSVATPVATDTGSSILTGAVNGLLAWLFPKPSTDPCHGMCS